MNYLIKSIKWTENDGIETWWKPNSCGYTTFICNAGVYNEEDKKKKKAVIGKDIVFVPLNEKIINKGREQVEELIRHKNKEIEHYNDYIKYTEESIIKTKEHFKSLDNMKNMII